MKANFIKKILKLFALNLLVVGVSDWLLNYFFCDDKTLLQHTAHVLVTSVVLTFTFSFIPEDRWSRLKKKKQ